MYLDKHGFPDMVRNGYSGYGDIGRGNVRLRAVETLSRLTTGRFLNFWYDESNVCLYTTDEIGAWDEVWRHEYDRRFLLRPAQYVPTKDSTLLRVVGE